MQSDNIRRHACGVAVLYADDMENADFWRKFGRAREEVQASFALIYFSSQQFDPEAIRRRMIETAPGLNYAACSTSGEITEAGITEGSLVAILFPGEHFAVSSLCINNIATAGMENIVTRVSEVKRQFLESGSFGESGGYFALCLIDGLSYAEESVTAALHWGLDDIPLLGGSSGDDLHFSGTAMIHNGELIRSGTILMLFKTNLPFHIFKTDNFVPTKNKLVVTRSDPDQRIVYEFNAAPAAEEYARAVGLDSSTLSPMSFASHPLVVKVGGEYYCRSVQKMNADGSLSFFCAIDDGVVLTVAEPAGMTRTTREAFEIADKAVGGIDFALGFECVLRRIDARNRQITQRIADIYRRNHVVGFHTYGEQYLSMHLNQTFTGIVFASEPLK